MHDDVETDAARNKKKRRERGVLATVCLVAVSLFTLNMLVAVSSPSLPIIAAFDTLGRRTSRFHAPLTGLVIMSYVKWSRVQGILSCQRVAGLHLG